MPEDIQIQECPHDDDFEIQPRVETIRRAEDGMPAKRIVSPYASPMPVPPTVRTQMGPWQVAVVRVEEIPAKMLRKRKPPMLQRIGKGRLIYLKLMEMMVQFCWTPPPPRAGVMKFDGPAGRSSHAEETRKPFRHMVRAQTDPAGQFCAGTPSPSDCYPVGPVGLVATDVYLTYPNLLTHVIRMVRMLLLALLARMSEGARLAQLTVYLL